MAGHVKDAVVEALNAAVPTLDEAEQRLVIQLYRALMAGKPVAVPDLAARVGWEVSRVEDALGRWPGARPLILDEALQPSAAQRRA